MIGSPGLLQTRESLALSRGDWRDDMAMDLIWARLYILLDQTRYQCSVLSDSKSLILLTWSSPVREWITNS